MIRLLCIIFGIMGAVLLHGGFLLFGGLLFGDPEKSEATTQEVELLTTEDEKEDKPEDVQPVEDEELETDSEDAPDAAEIIRELEQPVVNDAPALDAASLSAIEAALNGEAGAGGDFASAMSFTSGGRIGGTGKAGSLEESLENAFSLTELDQKPRPTFQTVPNYPSDMRGKKVTGVVTVIFIVDSAGKVSNPRVEKSSHPAFEKPALDAVKKWKFEPAVKGGQRVAAKMRVPIRFQPS